MTKPKDPNSMKRRSPRRPEPKEPKITYTNEHVRKLRADNVELTQRNWALAASLNEANAKLATMRVSLLEAENKSREAHVKHSGTKELLRIIRSLIDREIGPAVSAMALALLGAVAGMLPWYLNKFIA